MSQLRLHEWGTASVEGGTDDYCCVCGGGAVLTNAVGCVLTNAVGGHDEAPQLIRAWVRALHIKGGVAWRTEGLGFVLRV